MSGTATGAPPTGPYGPNLTGFANALAGLGNVIGRTTPQNDQQFMRPAPPPTWQQASPYAGNLLATILQMRQAAANQMGAPYQAGVAMPRVSLLQG